MIDDEWQDLFTYENERDAGVNVFRGVLIGVTVGLILFWIPAIVWLVWR